MCEDVNKRACAQSLTTTGSILCEGGVLNDCIKCVKTKQNKNICVCQTSWGENRLNLHITVKQQWEGSCEASCTKTYICLEPKTYK